MKVMKKYFFIIGFFLTAVWACNKEKSIIGEDPYAGGKEPLGIVFTGKRPIPQSASPGDTVIFQVKGLKKWNENFSFFINDQPTEVVNITDSTATVKVPDEVSSGIATINLKGQVFFGPRLAIINKVSLDPTFSITTGTNQVINSVCSFNNGYLLVGAFTDFNGMVEWWRKFNSIALLDASWEWNPVFEHNEGANGMLLSASRLSDGRFVISGNFTSFNEIPVFGNITILNPDLTIEENVVNVANQTTDPKMGLDTVSIFNGGVSHNAILESFVTSKDQIIAVGNFSKYGYVDYARSTRFGQRYVYTNVRNIMRMNLDGSLDSTYNFVPGPGNQGVNGTINDACIQKDDKVIMVGDFTEYNGIKANNIICIDSTGDVDQEFHSGSGANGEINTVRYNAIVDKIMLTGSFTSFNGFSCQGVVMLNGDGSVDEFFHLREMEGGSANFATVLNSGKVIVSGDFTTYDQVARPGFLILNADGSASQAYNNVGTFKGKIQQVIETQSALGYPAIVLAGYIQMFDDQRVGNIVRVQIRN